MRGVRPGTFADKPIFRKRKKFSLNLGKHLGVKNALKLQSLRRDAQRSRSIKQAGVVAPPSLIHRHNISEFSFNRGSKKQIIAHKQPSSPEGLSTEDASLQKDSKLTGFWKVLCRAQNDEVAAVLSANRTLNPLPDREEAVVSDVQEPGTQPVDNSAFAKGTRMNYNMKAFLFYKRFFLQHLREKEARMHAISKECWEKVKKCKYQVELIMQYVSKSQEGKKGDAVDITEIEREKAKYEEMFEEFCIDNQAAAVEGGAPAFLQAESVVEDAKLRFEAFKRETRREWDAAFRKGFFLAFRRAPKNFREIATRTGVCPRKAALFYYFSKGEYDFKSM